MKKWFIIPIIFLSNSICYAQIKLPRLLSDGMVLQRERPVRIWGKANVGEAVADAICIGVADLYRAEIVQQEFGHLVKIRKAHPTQTGYGVGIEHLRAKLVYMAKPSAPDAFFATFSMNSRMG